jgi:hypothetical protein
VVQVWVWDKGKDNKQEGVPCKQEEEQRVQEGVRGRWQEELACKIWVDGRYIEQILCSKDVKIKPERKSGIMSTYS